MSIINANTVSWFIYGMLFLSLLIGCIKGYQ